MEDLWLDSVLATPLVGLGIKPQARTLLQYGQLVAPLVDELLETGASVNITSPSPAVMTIDVNHGHTYRLAGNNINVDFRYTVDPAKNPQRLPTISTQPLHPFSDLLHNAIKELGRLIDAIAQHTPLTVERFGVVANIDLTEDALPPGLRSSLDRLGSPWGGERVESCNSRMLVNLQRTDKSIDRCHHQVGFDRTTGAGGIELSFDWQRIFKPPLQFHRGSAERHLVSYAESALAYFRQLAEGRQDG